MLDVAFSRAHTCLRDGQLGFGFDSWLWCLLGSVIAFAENLSRKSSTIVSLSSTFGNRFANFANDGSPTTYHLTVVNKNIVWFEVDLGEPYSINNFKLYYSKNVFAIKNVYTKQGLHYDSLLLRLKRNLNQMLVSLKTKFNR